MKIPPSIKKILDNPFWQVAIILFLFEAVLVPMRSHGDLVAIGQWGKYIFDNGIGKAYEIGYPDFNYPPVIAYPLFIFGQLVGDSDKIINYMYLFKCFFLLADFIAAVVLVFFINDRRRSILFLLLLVANPVFIYDSYLWGQADGMLSMFIFLAFVFLAREKLLWSIAFFMFALNFKVQAIIFIPPYVLMAYYVMAGKFSGRLIFTAIATVVITQFLILLPFIVAGEVGKVFNAVTNVVDYYRCISCNAYNVWYFIAGKEMIYRWKEDTLILAGLSYKAWGTIMFCALSFITLLPLFISCIFKFIKKRGDLINTNSLFLTFALIPTVFFYVNTQMHERYGQPGLLFVAAYSFATRRYWLFGILCLAYFINMEKIFWFFNLPNYGTVLFDPVTSATLYLVLIISLLYFLYKPFIGQLKALKYEQPATR